MRFLRGLFGANKVKKAVQEDGINGLVSTGLNAAKNIVVAKILAFIALPLGIILVIMTCFFSVAYALDGDDSGFGINFSGPSNNAITGGQGKYFNADTKVELINCDGTQNNYRVLTTMNLNEYIIGIVRAEMDDTQYSEALKAQAIASKTFALTRQNGMCPSNPSDCFYGYNSSTNTTRLRACEADQVFAYIDKITYRQARGLISLYSPEISSGTIWKQPLSEDRQKEFSDIIDSVYDKVAVDENDNLVYTNFTDTQTQQFISLAAQGMDYTEILMSVYPEVKGIATNSVSTAEDNFNNGTESSYNCPVVTDHYSTWKQYDSRWSSYRLGYSSSNNIGSAGCAITSVSIQLAKSGATTNGISNLNPCSFNEAMKANGGFQGGNIVWSAVSNFAPDFVYVGERALSGSKSQKLSQMSSALNEGYYVIVSVKNGGHYVALYDVDNNDAYIYDPGASSNTVFATYGNTANRILLYQKR